MTSADHDVADEAFRMLGDDLDNGALLEFEAVRLAGIAGLRAGAPAARDVLGRALASWPLPPFYEIDGIHLAAAALSLGERGMVRRLCFGFPDAQCSVQACVVLGNLHLDEGDLQGAAALAARIIRVVDARRGEADRRSDESVLHNLVSAFAGRFHEAGLDEVASTLIPASTRDAWRFLARMGDLVKDASGGSPDARAFEALSDEIDAWSRSSAARPDLAQLLAYALAEARMAVADTDRVPEPGPFGRPTLPTRRGWRSFAGLRVVEPGMPGRVFDAYRPENLDEPAWRTRIPLRGEPTPIDVIERLPFDGPARYGTGGLVAAIVGHVGVGCVPLPPGEWSRLRKQIFRVLSHLASDRTGLLSLLAAVSWTFAANGDALALTAFAPSPAPDMVKVRYPWSRAGKAGEAFCDGARLAVFLAGSGDVPGSVGLLRTLQAWSAPGSSEPMGFALEAVAKIGERLVAASRFDDVLDLAGALDAGGEEATSQATGVRLRAADALSRLGRGREALDLLARVGPGQSPARTPSRSRILLRLADPLTEGGVRDRDPDARWSWPRPVPRDMRVSAGPSPERPGFPG